MSNCCGNHVCSSSVSKPNFLSSLNCRKSAFDMFNFLASKHRQPPEYNPNDEEEEEVQLKSARYATGFKGSKGKITLCCYNKLIRLSYVLHSLRCCSNLESYQALTNIEETPTTARELTAEGDHQTSLPLNVSCSC